MKGSLVLYMILQAYNIFDIKVTGLTDRTVSITYTMTVGKVVASDSVIMLPDADQVNASICPGVSINTELCREMKKSNCLFTSLCCHFYVFRFCIKVSFLYHQKLIKGLVFPVFHLRSDFSHLHREGL